jgi:tripartite-type tricarboxylate transporter receptor subunit TctC
MIESLMQKPLTVCVDPFDFSSIPFVPSVAPAESRDERHAHDSLREAESKHERSSRRQSALRLRAGALRSVRTVLEALLALCAPTLAVAQAYPSKPIRLLVGFPAGGNADVSARAIATRLSQTLRTPLVVENRGGAAGSIAARTAARAAPDGYTLLWASPGALTVSQILEKNIGYDVSAFAPVGLAVTFCNALVARPEFAASSVSELIALAKAKPGDINYGSQGIGSAGHLSAELLERMAGIRFTHVPYKGGNDIMAALLGGELQMSFASSTVVKGMRNRMKVLAVTCPQRDPALPDIPTMNEAGVKGYDASFWFGLLGPARTPQPIIQQLNTVLRAAVGDGELMRPLQELGFIPAPSTPQQFAARIRADYVKWKDVLGSH